MQRALRLITLLLSLSACAQFGRDPEELSRVWQATWIYFPSDPAKPIRVSDPQFLSKSEAATAGKALSAVIFLHGCAGFETQFWEARIPQALAKAGFVTFVPDSFARGPGRHSACHNVRMDTVELRHAEVDSTLERIQSFSWIDKRNLFLAGHSEGGIATAMYGKHEFNAYFISGWTCSSPNPEFDRIHAPKTRPVLAVLGSDDEFYPATGGTVHCGNRMQGRPNSRSVVLQGYDHGRTVRDPATAELLTAFFAQQRQ